MGNIKYEKVNEGIGLHGHASHDYRG